MQKSDKFVKNLKNAWYLFLDFLLPQPEIVARLEKMTVPEFMESVSHADKIGLKKYASAIFDYKNPLVRRAIWELKYRGNKRIACLLANALYEEMIAEFSELEIFSNFKDPIIVPIPISKKRFRDRGYNQCRILTNELCKIDQEKTFKIIPDALKKIKDTESQTKTSSRQERLGNLKNCFEADRQKVLEKNIILIDDVITTGATAEEARGALLKAGAKKVMVFAVAH